MQGAYQVGGAAAVPATDFQHLVVGEVDLGCRAVVELKEEPVGFVGRLQRHGHRRIFLVAQVEAHQIITAEAAGEGIEALRHELRGFCGPIQAASEAHQWSITGCAEQFGGRGHAVPARSLLLGIRSPAQHPSSTSGPPETRHIPVSNRRAASSPQSGVAEAVTTRARPGSASGITNQAVSRQFWRHWPDG